jgi:transketolase
MAVVYEEVLAMLAERHPELVVITAENRAAIRGLPARLGPRFIDVGICEQTMVGAAAGLALCGRIPVCHALATFLTLRAYEFVRTDVGIGRLPVKLVGGVPGFLSEANGPTHQAIEDVAVMRAIPGMKIFCPSDAAELAAGMPTIVADPSPWYVRFCAAAPTVEHQLPFAPGVSEALSDGADVTVLAYGYLVREAMAAAGLLRKRGIGARVIDLRTVAPLDEEAVLEAARGSELVVTVEDHLLRGGLFSIVAELFAERRAGTRLVPLALPRWFRPGRLADVLEVEGFTGAHLARRIEAALRQAPGGARGGE